MHPYELPTEIRDRIIARRGRLFAHDRIVPAKTALLVVDMQDWFLKPEHPAYVAEARSIVPVINRLGAALRNAGGTVIWIITTYTANTPKIWPLLFESYGTPERMAASLKAMSAGGVGHALWHELDRRPSDWLVDKDRFSAFIQDSSDIEGRLQAAGIDHVLVAGTVTNVCCESTARDAMMRNFKVTMIADANAARSDADHAASLNALAQVFADVMTADEAIRRFAPTIAARNG